MVSSKCFIDKKMAPVRKNLSQEPFYFLDSLPGCFTVLHIKFLNTSGGVNQFLFTGKKWMANRTNINALVSHRAIYFESMTTGTVDMAMFVFGMDSLFHNELL